MSLANMTPAQKQAYFSNEDALIYAMFQVFAQGPAQYAGMQAATMKACTQGIKAVFDWWCLHGILLGGEKDLKDVAAQVAETIATAVYESDTAAACMQALNQYMKAKQCAPQKTGRLYTRPGRPARR